jgi:hypothetical protein
VRDENGCTVQALYAQYVEELDAGSDARSDEAEYAEEGWIRLVNCGGSGRERRAVYR